MINFKDMIFCDYYRDCLRGDGCPRALTESVIDTAKRWWPYDDPPIDRYMGKPDCFEAKDATTN